MSDQNKYADALKEHTALMAEWIEAAEAHTEAHRQALAANSEERIARTHLERVEWAWSAAAKRVDALRPWKVAR
jgi:hypothetical protein